MSIVKELEPRQQEIVQSYVKEIQRLEEQAGFLRQSLLDIIEFNMPEEADTFDIQEMAFIKKDTEDLDLDAD